MPYFSLIIPVYNRPDEVQELLESLVIQTYKNFEVVIIEDGSTVSCQPVVDNYQDILDIKYFSKKNSGPGQSRNYGAERSNGDFLIILDSDCIIPEQYLECVLKELEKELVDAFGGPDRALDSFSNIQKAINYAMTSFFTTGGIRGGVKKLDKFYPRSFNMGIRKDLYMSLGGFSKMRFGEDIDFSIRLYKNGCKVKLFPSAYVYHKRRTSWKKFYKQVFNSGIARINLYKLYPESLKLVHALPSLFVIFSFLCVGGLFVCPYSMAPIVLFTCIVFIDASLKNKNIHIGLLSVVASFIQLFGYGLGFLLGVWNRLILKKDSFSAFERTFYK